jgi:hypothetical protein
MNLKTIYQVNYDTSKPTRRNYFDFIGIELDKLDYDYFEHLQSVLEPSFYIDELNAFVFVVNYIDDELDRSMQQISLDCEKVCIAYTCSPYLNNIGRICFFCNDDEFLTVADCSHISKDEDGLFLAINTNVEAFATPLKWHVEQQKIINKKLNDKSVFDLLTYSK